MSNWFAGLGGAEFATAVIWTLAALVLLVIVLVVVRLVRNMTSGTFVAGGRNRKTRLAVMDATAVDSHRRLVLVRRDDIEHLLLIGGPTDVVVEREIRVSGARRTQSVFGDETETEAQQAHIPGLPIQPPAQQPPPRPRAPEPMQSQPTARSTLPPQPARQPERPQPQRQPERTSPPPRPMRQTGSRPPARDPMPQRAAPSRLPPASLPPIPAAISSGSSSRSPASGPSHNLDDDLLHELEVTFDATASPPSFDPSSFDESVFDPPPAKTPAKPVEMTLDDEMTKLLGELSSNQR